MICLTLKAIRRFFEKPFRYFCCSSINNVICNVNKQIEKSLNGSNFKKLEKDQSSDTTDY